MIIQQNSRISHHTTSLPSNMTFSVPLNEDFTTTTSYTWTDTDLALSEFGVSELTGKTSIRVGGDIHQIAYDSLSPTTLIDNTTIEWYYRGASGGGGPMSIQRSYAEVTIEADRDININGSQPGDSGTLKITQGSPGNFRINFPHSFTQSVVYDGIGLGPNLFPSGTYSYATQSGTSDIYRFYYDGNQYFWTIENKYALATASNATGYLGYLVYQALITQSATGSPTVVELANTIGAIVWTRSSIGVYHATLGGAFTLNKTMYFISPSSPIFMALNPIGQDVIYVQTQDINGASVDSALNNNSIEIRVYP